MQSIKQFIKEEKECLLESSKVNYEKWWKGEEITKEDEWTFYNSKANLNQLKSICANTDSRESRRWDKRYYGAKKCAQDLISMSFLQEKENIQMKNTIQAYRAFFKEELERYQ
jgi:hypothetical protein